MSNSKGGTRGRKPSSEKERKSSVIQTRVPKDLEDTLKHAAETKRMSVSHLIRNVLDDTFSFVDGIVTDSSTLMENASRDAKRIAASARGETLDDANRLMEEVDSWQDVIVNKSNECLMCQTEIKRGKRAYRGLSQNNLAEVVWLCESCIENL